LNQPIPRELFAAVAQVLVFAYNLSGKSPPNQQQ
ncbi:MAG: flagellar protein FhlB, partial [Thiotrichales bacterium 24-47-4]